MPTAMNQREGIIGKLLSVSAPTVAAGVVAGFALALMAVLTLGLPIWSLLLVAAALAYAILVILNPIVGLLVVVCIFFLPIQLSGVSLLQLCGAATSGLMLLWLLHQRRGFSFEPILLPLFVMGLLILASLSYVYDVPRTSLLFRTWLFNFMFILLAAFNVVVAIFQFGTSAEYGYRAEGLMGHTTRLGHISSTAFPLAFYQFLYRADRLKWLGLGLSALLFAGVVVSAGRTPTIALVVVIIVIMITERRRVAPVILVAVLGLATVPFLPDYYHSRVGNLLSDIKNSIVLTNDEELTDRGHLNKSAIKIWLTRPLFGVGLGNFGHYFVQKDFNPGFKRSNKVPPHNIYMQALVEMGVVGLAVLLWLLSLAVWHVLRARRLVHGDPYCWHYIGGVQMMTLAVLISSSTTGHLIGKTFWLFICLAAISHRVAERIKADS